MHLPSAPKQPAVLVKQIALEKQLMVSFSNLLKRFGIFIVDAVVFTVA